jgi:hypothetical protein
MSTSRLTVTCKTKTAPLSSQLRAELREGNAHLRGNDVVQITAAINGYTQLK